MVATLAVPNGLAMPAPTVDAQASGNYSPEALGYPQPMTTNADEHSAAVKAYLTAARVLAAEVSGMNVTTTMAGGGPVRDGCSRRSQSCFGTRPIWSGRWGIPVESSYTLLRWTMPVGRSREMSIGRRSRPMSCPMPGPSSKGWRDRRSELPFLPEVRKAKAAAGDIPASVRIVRTSAGYHGPFQALAVYSTVVPSPGVERFKSCALMRMVRASG